jgi:hypothetical protein
MYLLSPSITCAAREDSDSWVKQGKSEHLLLLLLLAENSAFTEKALENTEEYKERFPLSLKHLHPCVSGST